MSQKQVDKTVLKRLVPASALNGENFEEFAAKAFQEEIAAGKVIFKQGDHDKKNVYILEGEVELTNTDGDKHTVTGGTDAARHPIGNHQPRTQTAVARTSCVITRIDGDLLDILLTWDQLSGIEVDEISASEEEDDESGDWMTRILQSKAFLQIPPANIQAMFMRMQEVPVRAGETIIKQGDDGDYYYIIKSGKCKVTRTSKTGSELTLAQLSDGDAFGEEALLSEAKRNANVTMTTDGTLMRLSQDDFNSLLKEPMLSWVSRQQADEMVKQHGAVMMDVRLETEHQNNGFDGSLNIPLFMLRLKADNLDASKSYIVYCDTGRRSSAAAYLLNERGLQAYCLQGGLVAQPDSAA